MDKSHNQGNRGDPTGGTGPQESSGPMRKWLDNFLTPGEAGAEPPADPIARNPKDEGKPGEAVQAMEVRRRREVAVPAEGLARLAGLTGRFPPHPAPSVADLLASILRFKWTILIVWILVSAPIIAMVWTQIVPQYQARRAIRVRPVIPRVLFRTDENGTVPFYDSFVNTQVGLILSPKVLDRVLEEPKVQQTRWYRSPPQSLRDRLRGGPLSRQERLRDALSVRPRPRTEFIDVFFQDPNASDAVIIVDAVVEQYDRYNLVTADVAKRDVLKKLQGERQRLSDDIRMTQQNREQTVKILQTENPQELIAAKRLRLDEVQARINALDRSITLLIKPGLDSLLGRILRWSTTLPQQEIKPGAAAANGGTTVAAPDSNEMTIAAADSNGPKLKYYEDAEWRKLDLDVQVAQHQIDTSIMTPSHPQQARLVKNLEFAKGLRKHREQQLDKQQQSQRETASTLTTSDARTSGSGVASVSPELQLKKDLEERALLIGERDEFNRLFAAAQALERYDNDLRRSRDELDGVKQRLNQMDVEFGAAASIQTEGYFAVPSSRPVQDRRVVFTVMALMAGLGLGGGAGFLRASRNQTIYAPQDMPQPARVPLLGYMPLIHLDKPVGEALSKEIEQKQGALIESVRVLRTALLTRLNGHGQTTVVVTSANQGTGKSSVTLVLGKSIAHAGRKVLMIDADLRKMGLSKRLNMTNRPGFRESLKDGTAENLHVFATGTAGLDVMPAGLRGKDGSVSDEIAHHAFKSWLGRLVERYGYEIILLDAPPLLPVADAAILAGQVDTTVLVEREHVSRRAEVASALLLLGSTGGHLLGTVFVGSAEHSHYGYGYGYDPHSNRTSKS
jgi:Mrp family chromosome partitioning ATPase